MKKAFRLFFYLLSNAGCVVVFHLLGLDWGYAIVAVFILNVALVGLVARSAVMR